jgi:hypothetical protein
MICSKKVTKLPDLTVPVPVPIIKKEERDTGNIRTKMPKEKFPSGPDSVARGNGNLIRI